MTAAMTVLCSAASVAYTGGDASFRCDFSEGIPASVSLYDVDGNTLSADVAKYGFRQGDAWVALMLPDEDNAVACSTSWYSPKGTSSDWMVLPALTVDEGAKLEWRAKAADRRFRDGYAVYVSETASEPADFLKEEPVLKVDAEQADWTSHSLPLDKWTGKRVRVAFVNNSTDCSRLYVDDISMGIPSDVSLEMKAPAFLVRGRELVLNGHVTNSSDKDLDSFSLELEIEGSHVEKRFDLPVKAGERVAVEWPTGFCTGAKGVKDYILRASAGNTAAERAGSFRVVDHKVLAEEGTGTWCGYCVRGIVGIRQAREKYPDNYLAIAIHSNDVMETDDYGVRDVMSATGLPACIINRKYPIDPNPSLMQVTVERALKEDVRGALDLTLAPDGEDRYTFTANVCFPGFFSDADYRLAAFVYEDDVYHPEDPANYSQSNGYAGGSEAMGGFEKQPSTVPASKMHYNEVARAAILPVKGEPGSVPSAMKQGEVHTFTRSFTLPSNVDHAENASLLVVLLDAKSGEVLNAEALPLTGGDTSLDSVQTGETPHVAVSGRTISSPGAGLSVYTPAGALVARSSDGVAEVPAPGIYVVLVHAGSRTYASKVSVR